MIAVAVYKSCNVKSVECDKIDSFRIGMPRPAAIITLGVRIAGVCTMRQLASVISFTTHAPCLHILRDIFVF